MNKMKSKSIICLLLLGMMFGMFSTSCQDMLSPDSERHSYTVAEDTLYSYWGILKSLQNIAERYVILNECRGDLVDENSSFVSDTIGAIVNFGEVKDPEKWKDGACAYLRISDYYHIINSCNAYIAECDLERTTGTSQKYMVKEYAQVQAIRAWVYMQLLYAYGENRVPFYTEPMLTTDNINNFIADKNHTLLNAQILAEKLGPELESVEPVEVKMNDPQYQDMYQGMPGYNNYGDADPKNSHFVCHSSKCLFPIPIVLGDLYLLAGKYVAAAQHYYNYINTKYCGPLPVDKYHSIGRLDDRLDYPIYSYDSHVPYTERGEVSRETEMITCIPSNKGKLEGRVLTDINRLFGFEAQMRTGIFTSLTIKDDGNVEQSSDISSTIFLSREYERELLPSRGYEALCDSQKYEIYVGTTTNGNFKFEGLVELPGVGDARRAWIYQGRGQQWNFSVGDDILYGKMVSKQNPSGGFITTYPVIYRKSTVWLRYAEALNRAGYPSYAFAILKTGLCNNPEWFPTDPDKATMVNGDYVPVTEQVFPYFTSTGEVNTRSRFDYPISTYAELEAWLTEYFEAEYEAWLAEHREDGGNNGQSGDEPFMEGPRQIDKNYVFWKAASESAIGNEPASDCGVACYYLDRREVARAADAPYLDFKQPYLRGQNQSQLLYVKEQGKLLNETTGSMRIPESTSADNLFTIGVHQRGCGFIRYDDPEEFGRSSFNYVKMVQKKIKEATGKNVTEEDIYSGDYDKEVQDAVEDLIIDECALELAFEGSRFSDLCRVALRRGNPDYLAQRVAKRHTGKIDESLRSRLQNKNNWFLPIPEE